MVIDNENAATACRVLHSRDPLLAFGSIGAFALAANLADFVAVPAGLFGS
jgi:hypothetical protein